MCSYVSALAVSMCQDANLELVRFKARDVARATGKAHTAG